MTIFRKITVKNFSYCNVAIEPAHPKVGQLDFYDVELSEAYHFRLPRDALVQLHHQIADELTASPLPRRKRSSSQSTR